MMDEMRKRGLCGPEKLFPFQHTESPLFSKLFVSGLNAMLRDLKVGSADFMSSGSKKTSVGRIVK